MKIYLTLFIRGISKLRTFARINFIKYILYNDDELGQLNYTVLE